MFCSCFRYRITPQPLVQSEETFSFTPEDEISLKQLNDTRLSNEIIKRIGRDLLKNHTQLHQEQERLFKFVQYSRISERHTIAASNAFSILKETGFSFQGVSLKNVSLPFADLSYTILNKVDFTNANLQGVNLANSSCNGTIFNGANFDQVNLGILPHLKHDSEIIQMILFPDQSRLVTLDLKSVYVWNLKTQQLVKKEPPRQQTFQAPCLLLLSSDEKHFLRIYMNQNIWMIDILDADSFQKTTQILFSDKRRIKKFVSTADGNYLVVSNNAIEIWELNLEHIPKFELKSKHLSKTVITSCAYHQKTNTLAIFSHPRIKFCSLSELTTLNEIRGECPINYKSPIVNLEFSSNGNALLIGCENCFYSWNFKEKHAQANLLFSEEGPQGTNQDSMVIHILWMKLLPETSILAYCASSPLRFGEKLCIRDIEKPQILISEKYSSSLKNLEKTFSPFQIELLQNDNTIIMCDDKQVNIQHVEKVFTYERQPENLEVIDVRFSQDNEQIFILTSQGILHQFSSLTGKPTSNARPLMEQSFRERHVFLRNWLTEFKDLGDEAQINIDRFNIFEGFSIPILSILYACSFSADGSLFIGEYHDKGKGHLRLSQTESGTLCQEIEKDYLAYAATKDNQYLVFLEKKALLDESRSRLGDVLGLELMDIPSKKKLGIVPVLPFTDCKRFNIAISTDIHQSGYVVIGKDGNASLHRVDWSNPTISLTIIFEFSYPYKHLNLDQLRVFEWNVKFVKNKLLYINAIGKIVQYNLKTSKISVLSLSNSFGSCEGFCISPNEQYLVITNTNHMALWDLHKNELLDMTETSSSSLVFSPDGHFISSWGKEKLQVWQIENNRFKIVWQIPQTLEFSNLNLQKIENLSFTDRELLKDSQS